MDLSKCFYLGYIARVFETRNQVEIKLDVDDPSAYLEIESVLIQFSKGDLTPIPLFIIRVESLTDKVLRVQLDPEQVLLPIGELKGKQVYRPLSTLRKLSGNAFYYHEVIGFDVIDEKAGNIGIVKDVYDLPSNPLLAVLSGEKEILIPLSNEIVMKMDRKEKCLMVRTPEGLIDLYTD